MLSWGKSVDKGLPISGGYDGVLQASKEGALG